MAFNSGASSGNLVLIQKQVANASSGLTFTSGVSGYDYYYLSFYNATVGTNASSIALQVSTNGGASYLNTNYNASGSANYSSALNNYTQTAAVSLVIGLQLDSASTASANGEVFMYNFSSASLYKTFNIRSNGYLGGPIFEFLVAGNQASISVVNAFQIIPSAGTFSGTFKLYGVQN